MRHRVVVYVERDHYLLVFEHRDHPDSGTQVPAGGLEPGEDVRDAAVREGSRGNGRAPDFRANASRHARPS
ncbi:MAG: NUDIX domain-containing protein [Actinobacteria bacterium]|nr:NUDIX domain-containing protein [Actinomycetota bacterium]